jgi:hypothetical protein
MARKELEARTYNIQDVAFNISRATCLPAVIRLRQYSLLAAVTEDKIHQMQRAKTLFTDGRKPIDVGYILHSALEAGAYASFIGGAGSTLIALVHVANADSVAERFRGAFEEVALGTWSVQKLLTLEITNRGAVCELKEGDLDVSPLVQKWFESIDPRWFPLTAGPIKPRVPVPHHEEPRPAAEPQVLAIVRHTKRISVKECAVVGEYLRYDEQVRNTLRDWRNRIESPLLSTVPSSDNFLIWAAPGSGKSFLIQQIAKANKDRVQYEELNLAQLSRSEWLQRLADVRGCTKPTLCLLDEIDARADEDWPYDECFADLELGQSRKIGRTVVFALVGSHPKGMQGMLEAMIRRRHGRDLVDRIPIGNRFEIPPPTLEDRAVAFVSCLVSASREVRQVEQLALYHVLSSPDLGTLRQLRDLAVAVIERRGDSDERVRYYDLFEKYDPRQRQPWLDNQQLADELSNKFLLIEG